MIFSIFYSIIRTHPKQECQTQEKNKWPCARLTLLKWKSKGPPDITPNSVPPLAFFFTNVFFEVFIFLGMGNNILDPDKSIEESKSTESRAKDEDIETAKAVSDSSAKEESKDHSCRDCGFSCREPSQSRLWVIAGQVAHLSNVVESSCAISDTDQAEDHEEEVGHSTTEAVDQTGQA